MKKAILILLLISFVPFCRTLPDVVKKPDIKRIDRLIEEKKKLPQTEQVKEEIEILEDIKASAIENHETAIIATHEAKKNEKAAGQIAGLKAAGYILIFLLIISGGIFIYMKLR